MKKTFVLVCFAMFEMVLLIEPAGAASARRFYVTENSNFDGAQALQACAPGFHMASLWEIYETSDLRYDRNLGFNTSDSGFGPPAGVFGWVRTGGSADVATVGIANCSAWTTNNSSFEGTLIELPVDWENIDLGIEIGSWHAGTANCDFKTRVWCLQN